MFRKCAWRVGKGSRGEHAEVGIRRVPGCYEWPIGAAPVAGIAGPF